VGGGEGGRPGCGSQAAGCKEGEGTLLRPAPGRRVGAPRPCTQAGIRPPRAGLPQDRGGRSRPRGKQRPGPGPGPDPARRPPELRGGPPACAALTHGAAPAADARAGIGSWGSEAGRPGGREAGSRGREPGAGSREPGAGRPRRRGRRPWRGRRGGGWGAGGGAGAGGGGTQTAPPQMTGCVPGGVPPTPDSRPPGSPKEGARRAFDVAETSGLGGGGGPCTVGLRAVGSGAAAPGPEVPSECQGAQRCKSGTPSPLPSPCPFSMIVPHP
jgi:translation initiation factor IF-2